MCRLNGCFVATIWHFTRASKAAREIQSRYAGTIQESRRQQCIFSPVPPHFSPYCQLNDVNGKSQPIQCKILIILNITLPLRHSHRKDLLELDTATRMWKARCGADRSTIENSSGPLLRSTTVAQAPPEWMETSFSASTIIVTLHLPQLSACQRLSELNLQRTHPDDQEDS